MDTAGFPTPVAELEPVAGPKRGRPAVLGGGIALVVVTVVALVVGSGGTQWKSNRVVLSEAATRTTDSGTARVTGTGTLILDGNSRKLLDVSGAENFGAKTAELTMKVGPLTEQMRSVAGVTYLSVSGVDLPRGAHWLTLTAADLKLSAAAAASIGSQNPTSGLRFLKAANGTPVVVDHNPLEGVDVTHYQFTLDLKSLFQTLGTSADAVNAGGFGAAIRQLGSLMDLSAVPGEAWIDAQGRVRRFEMTFDVTAEGQHVTAVDDFSFSHFGEAVQITAPPASDTVPFRDDPGFFGDIGRAAIAGRPSAG